MTFPSDRFISLPLPGFLHHRLRADAVPSGRVVHEYVGHGANELPVLDNGAAAQECVKTGTTFFSLFHLLFYIPYHNHSFGDGFAALFSVL